MPFGFRPCALTHYWVILSPMNRNRASRSARRYAVLMGDLIGSERSTSPNTMHHVFNRAVDTANRRYQERIASPLTITLGDEFQGLSPRLADAWEIAASMRLQLLLSSIACRFVVGLAELATPLNTDRAWNMMGTGLGAARAKLNDKRADNAYRFSLLDEPLIEPLLDAIGDSLTQVELGWTETQLEYYTKTRDSTRTNVEIAESLKITPRSLYKVLQAARADFHSRQSSVLRTALAGLDAKYGLT